MKRAPFLNNITWLILLKKLNFLINSESQRYSL
nr:MAG TPA: hypothetical protein [Caudoviricetes sp.]